MKHPILLSLILTALFLTGCSGVYDYGAPSLPYVPPAIVPGCAWIGPGYYGGFYYGTSTAYYNSAYYRNVNATVYRSPNGGGTAYHGAYGNAG